MDFLFGDGHLQTYAWPALVTLLLVIQYMAFTALCGAARVKAGIKAPACEGDTHFERTFRVQMNTLEQLMTVIPALWMCALFFRPDVAAICGVIFFVGRLLYRASYLSEPEKRAPGMVMGFLASVVMVLSALWGVISALL